MLLKLIILACFLFIAHDVYSACECDDPKNCDVLVRSSKTKEILAFVTKAKTFDAVPFEFQNPTSFVVAYDFLLENEQSYIRKMVCKAHAKEQRIVIQSTYNADDLLNTYVRDKWIASQLQKVHETFTDGININFTDPIELNSKEMQGLTDLVQDLSTALHKENPNYHITFNVAWSPNCIDARCFDYKSIAKHVDYIYITSYNMQSHYGTTADTPCLAGANSHIQRVEEGIKAYLDIGISSNQLSLGLPWFGYTYRCNNNITSVESTKEKCQIDRSDWRGTNCSDVVAVEVPYSVIQSIYKQAKTKSDVNHEVESESYYFTYIDESQEIVTKKQIWYDTALSLAQKYDIARRYQLRGVGMWHAGCLDYSSKNSKEFWEAMSIGLVTVDNENNNSLDNVNPATISAGMKNMNIILRKEERFNNDS